MTRQARDHTHLTVDVIDPDTDQPPESATSGLQLVGPFRVSFDTPDIAIDDILLVELPVGTIVWGIRVIGIEAFDGNKLNVLLRSGTAKLAWQSRDNPGPEETTPLWAHNAGNDDTLWVASTGGVIEATSNPSYPTGLYATMTGGEPMAAGASDIYALILEPS